MYGGLALAAPTCQILPAGVSGYRRYWPYTRDPAAAGRWTAPNLARARRLTAASGTRGTPVTVWGWTDDPTTGPQIVRYVAGVLRRLGYPSRVHLVTHCSLAHPPPRVFKRIQLIPAGWSDTSYGFFATWFGCAGALDPRVVP